MEQRAHGKGPRRLSRLFFLVSEVCHASKVEPFAGGGASGAGAHGRCCSVLALFQPSPPPHVSFCLPSPLPLAMAAVLPRPVPPDGCFSVRLRSHTTAPPPTAERERVATRADGRQLVCGERRRERARLASLALHSAIRGPSAPASSPTHHSSTRPAPQDACACVALHLPPLFVGSQGARKAGTHTPLFRSAVFRLLG